MKKDLKKDPELIFIPQFNDIEVMAGQGTIGLEIFEDSNYCCICRRRRSMCWFRCKIKSLNPNCRIFAVSGAKFPNTYIKYQKEKNGKKNPISETEPLTEKKALADGLAVTVPGEMTFPYVSKYADEFVVVSENEISCSINLLAQRCKIIVEGAGAATLAAVLFKKSKYEKGENIVCILS